ncbi:TonB-dependent receptor [Pseudoalteromonas sp. Of7M-16]|uniref:TonB-dependent receptor n=1 Tax=Pseudoalteromonas sp. Of7M-16 TaxID=2917756 RepID=UPI001EF577A0|nr:TonB-dependent receptor [Pseudoalteromonas sp. Of7M-16]MCG7550835.1 TonB-dependent receptor [Pseudoalteromonas sp. Of7M-16]
MSSSLGRLVGLSPLYCGIALALGAHSGATLADEQELEKIMVTGQKIDRSLQETPTSVAVLTAAKMEKENIQDFYDITMRTPNVSGDPSTGYRIRGIDSYTITGGGNGGLARIYVDGAALSEDMTAAGAFSTWDLQQVEVLRGPQSTLQGRSALAGAVVVKTRDAEHTASGKARVIYGQNGQQQAAVAFGGSLIEDELAFRVAAEHKQRDGDIYNPLLNKTMDDKESDMVRVNLAYTPSAMKALTARLSYSNFSSENGTLFQSNVSPDAKYPINDLYEQRYLFINTDAYTENDAQRWVMNLDYDLSAQWLVSYTGSYSDSDYIRLNDSDFGIAKSDVWQQTNDDKRRGHEVKFTYSGDKLSGIFGVFVANDDRNMTTDSQISYGFAETGVKDQLVAQFTKLGLPAEALANQVIGIYQAVGADPVLVNGATNPIEEVENRAVFADFVYQINDQWSVFGGARWDKETRANSSVASQKIAPETVLPNPQNFAQNPQMAQLIGGVNQLIVANAERASGEQPRAEESFTSFLPKLGATHHIDEAMSVSLSYQKGYRSGGLGVNTTKNKIYTYDPEYTHNYELSWRSTWLDDTLVLNANAFYIDWREQQVRVQLSGNLFDLEVVNAGKSEVKGFETSAEYAWSDTIQLSAGVGYAKTEITEFEFNDSNVVTGDDFVGRAFPKSPNWTANLAIDYDSGTGWLANMNMNYQSSAKQFAAPVYQNLDANGQRVLDDPEIPSRTIVNARVGYQPENWGVFLSVNNLLDKDYLNSKGSRRWNYVELGQEREVALQLEYSF